MEPLFPRGTGRPASILAISSTAPSPQTCRCCSRQSSISSSTRQLPVCSASKFRRRCSPAPTRSSSDQVAAKNDGNGNVTKVLYVEHNDDNLYMLKTRLELRGGFEVLAAEDSEKGCKLAATEHPDVILLDLEMPDDDRWEAVRRLKNDPQTRDIPIIGMSAHAVESEREKAIATGCDEFDAKPIEFETLVATIRRVLAPHK